MPGMTIDKAIEILSDHVKISKLDYLPDVRDATKLSIKALKFLRDHRNEVYFRYDLPLPGETED